MGSQENNNKTPLVTIKHCPAWVSHIVTQAGTCPALPGSRQQHVCAKVAGQGQSKSICHFYSDPDCPQYWRRKVNGALHPGPALMRKVTWPQPRLWAHVSRLTSAWTLTFCRCALLAREQSPHPAASAVPDFSVDSRKLIPAWRLPPCSDRTDETRRRHHASRKEKDGACQPPQSLSSCAAVNQGHLTQLLFLSVRVSFFPMITQHKLRASLLTSESWATLEWGSPAAKTRFPFSTGYTTNFPPICSHFTGSCPAAPS